MTDLADLLRKPTAPIPAGPRSSTDHVASGYAKAALERELDAVEAAQPGTRNHALNVAAFNLGQLVAAGQLPLNETRDALTTAGLRAGLGAIETTKTTASGLKAGMEQPRALPELHTAQQAPAVTILPDPLPEPAAAVLSDDDTAAVKRLLPALDWQALWDDEDTEDWILEPLIPARRLVAVFSAPKVGKSLLMLEVAVGLSRGVTTLGVDVEEPHHVLYVDYENDPRGDVRQRLRAMHVGPHHLGNLHYLSFPVMGGLDTETGAAMLMAAVAAYECDVVVIDTVSRAVTGEENDNDTWLSFYRHAGLAMKQAGVTCVRLDHSGKDADKGMRGGSAKYSDVDAVWRLTEAGSDLYRLECTDNRLPITEKVMVLRRQKFPLRHTVAAEGTAAVTQQKVDEIVAALDAAGVPDDVGRKAASKALTDAGVSHNSASNDRHGNMTPLSKALAARQRRLITPPPVVGQ